MREFKRLLVTCIYALLDRACQRFSAGMKRSTGEIVHRGLRYELMPVSMFVLSSAEKIKLLILRPTRHPSALLFHRVISVSDGKPWSVSTILVFFGLDPAPPSFRHAHPPKQC